MKAANYKKIDGNGGKTRIVVLGTGFAGSAFMESFSRNLPRRYRDNVDLIAVNNTNYLTFSPLLHEVATGEVFENHITIPVRSEIINHGFKFLEEEIKEVIPERDEVVTEHSNLKYDYLVMALGSENNDFGIEGVAEHAIPLKTIKNGELIRNKIMESVRNAVSAEHSGGSTNGKLTFTIIGGGASGVELAASTKEYVDSLLYDYKVTGLASRVILIEAQGHLMEGSGNAFSTRLESLLKESGIELLLNAKVTKVTEDEILLDNRNFIKTSNVFWTAGVKNSSVAAMMGGSHVNKKSGRIIVDQFLRIPGFENIAVIGDNGLVLTQVQNQYVPPTAAAAVQEGNYLGVRLASVVRERKNNVPFIYRDKGTMLSLGRFNGLYKLQNGFILSGFSAWLAWRLIHIIKISTFQNKVEVFSDWFSLTLHRRDVIRSH